METADGIVTLVQEGRFKLVTEEGRVMHFMLTHDASIEPEDLPPLAQAQTPVRVAYTKPKPDHLIVALAHSLYTREHEALETTG